MRWMDPNTQRGQKAGARSSVKKRKVGYIVKPKCFISHAHNLLFPSTLKSILNVNQLVLLSSLSVLPQKVCTTQEEDIVSHLQEPAQILFCLPAPPGRSVASWLFCSSAQTATTEQSIFCKAETEGSVKSSLCVNIS